MISISKLGYFDLQMTGYKEKNEEPEINQKKWPKEFKEQSLKIHVRLST